jgi:hypothetical protein
MAKSASARLQPGRWHYNRTIKALTSAGWLSKALNGNAGGFSSLRSGTLEIP